MSSVYVPVLAGWGLSVTTINDGPDAPFDFPTPFTSAEYPVLIVLGGDNWMGAGSGSPEANISLTDEAAIAAYLDTGGSMLFVAQDYLLARGSAEGFPGSRLGVASYVDDVNFGDTDVAYSGVPSGALANLSGALHAETGPVIGPCFLTNPFFTDHIVPVTQGLVDIVSQPSSTEAQAGTTLDAGVFRTVFSTIDFACTSETTQFVRDLSAVYFWLTGDLPAVQPVTWGKMKRIYQQGPRPTRHR
jgi:hypothetical protein